MVSSLFGRFQALLVHPDPRRQRRAILAVLILVGVIIGLVIGLAGPAIALALVVVAIGGGLVIRSPLWGLVGIVAVATLLPFATLPFKIGFTPTFLNVAVFATLAVWAFTYATRTETRLEVSAIGGLVALFLGLAVLAFALGLRHARPTPNHLRQFLEMVLSIILFFVVINTVRTRAQLVFLARVLMLGGTAAAAFGVLFYILPREVTVWILNRLTRLGYPGGFGALRFVNDDPDGLMRAIGTSVDPNVLGGLMVLVGVFTATQAAATMPLFRRRWVLLMLGLQGLCLYLTISRGSMLGFVIGLLAIGILRYRRLVLLLGLGGLLFFVLPLTQDYVQHLLAGFAGQDRATQMRFGEYRDALTLISRYPLFGVGFVGTPEIGLYIGVSSLYLLMAEEMGLVGLSVFLLLMAAFVNALLVVLRRRPQPPLEALLLGVLGSMIGLLAAGVFDHYLFNLTYPHMTALLWVLIGLGMATVRQTRSSQPATGARAA